MLIQENYRYNIYIYTYTYIYICIVGDVSLLYPHEVTTSPSFLRLPHFEFGNLAAMQIELAELEAVRAKGLGHQSVLLERDAGCSYGKNM